MRTFRDHLQRKGLSQATQKLYIYNLHRFMKWYATTSSAQGKGDPIDCTKKDILNYLDHLQNTRKLQSASRKPHLIALDHYYRSLGLSEVTSFIKLQGTKKKKLHAIFSSEELGQLYDDYHHSLIQNFEPKSYRSDKHNRINLLSKQRNHAMLGFLVYQGLTSTELDILQISSIDLIKARLTITRKGKERSLPLHASQVGMLMHYTQQIRPHFLSGKMEADPALSETEGKLFLPFAERAGTGTKSNRSVNVGVKNLVKELRTLHPKFSKLAQLRASVITHWIKSEGLRKAQYLAGHKSINSTEEYLPNDLEELTEELVKFNPF